MALENRRTYERIVAVKPQVVTSTDAAAHAARHRRVMEMHHEVGPRRHCSKHDRFAFSSIKGCDGIAPLLC